MNDQLNMPEFLSLLADAATALAVIVVIIAIIQYFNEVRRRKTEFAKVERSRQEEAFETITTHYMNFLAMCMDNPDLSLSQLAISESPAQLSEDPVLRRRDLILFEYFFQLLEKVYVLYRADEIYETAPDAKFNTGLLDDYQTREIRARNSDDYDLRHRQWWGWDEWIRTYMDSSLGPRIAEAWSDLDNETTNDTGFSAYVGSRIARMKG